MQIGNHHKGKIQKTIFGENDFKVTKSIHKRTQTLNVPGKVTKDEP